MQLVRKAAVANFALIDIICGRATRRRAKAMLCALLLPVLCLTPLSAAPARDGGPDALPRFRHVDAALASMTLKHIPSIRFLVSDDFPPFVYRSATGALTGYSIAVAQGLCREARIDCKFAVLKPEKLTSALQNDLGEAILYGLRMTPDNFKTMDFTRPYMKALGVFAGRRHTPVKAADARALAGKRIGVVKGAVHARWLAQNYTQSRIQPYAGLKAATEALRTAKTDVLFGDWLQLSFWTKGAASKDCCHLLPGWFPARDFAWNDLAIAVRRGDDTLRNTLDRHLDAMQKDGRLSAIARRFLPAPGGRDGK